ncbi:hypothetical protein CHLNCDRAFT_33132 [Chlorella variabilis]|uniref:Inosine/uridine-preferring nucleoside hydrolase domain-containing protein n=1 Tax=Chlorella variabilis TaxID=554065 RepID=E1ZS88_CHLVA|nr:hypothetical protein CHLNCDRAFT_33132 [Chlorella variabilis]EFN51205.1 hypothetical protein CHLNCDRAFT_33132 [Chlorella variabilis]|eukprot:XP_005843307.1 hypothetical protein CHLNCDRAFT_33132 [Chlorella variabilis]
MCSKRKLCIDVDVGVDDAQGLMLVLAHPDAHIVGISAVHGNVDVARVGRNIARVLTLCGRTELPFYLGADEPLVPPAAAVDDASFFHGKDGLGDVPEAVPASSHIELQAQPGHGALQLARAAQEHEGELTVVATGPLTNVALACKMDAQFPHRVGRLVVMGGAEGAGNVTPCAEYNFHCDAESAHLVMCKFPQLVLVSWNATVRHALPWCWVDAWLGKPTRKAAFMRAIMAASMALEKERDADAGWIACDPLAFALAVCDEALLAAEPKHCVVELQGSLTRGMSVFQEPGGEAALPANVLLVTDICMQRFQALMDAATD